MTVEETQTILDRLAAKMYKPALAVPTTGEYTRADMNKAKVVLNRLLAKAEDYSITSIREEIAVVEEL